jgi:hypothetical protein
MNFNIMRYKVPGRWGAALMLAAVMWAGAASPAAAIDLNPANYFQLTYDPVTFDKNSVTAGETFHATLKGKASCTRTLPFSPSQATIELRIIASHDAGGGPLTLNESYVISIKPFPHKKGETFEIECSIPLKMPSSAAPGDYTVTGKLIEAKVKILFFWQGVTGAFPKEYSMGTVEVIDPETAALAVETPIAASESPAPESAPPPDTNPEPDGLTEPTPEQPGATSNGWVVLLLVVIVAAAATGATLLIRHHKKGR